MCKYQFDGDQFEFDDMDAFYETFNDLPEHRRKEFLQEVYDLDPIKYKNFIKFALSAHPEYDPDKYKIGD
ncbi:hypothetical protein [uncultured Methanobrevibacter sp.]|uniref:hypothetical protein n=1 Tax=uncultured Methanobrevibacter sp. TaxID=253161 RepID=UPI0026DF26F5|nr:hypothetical protein [uncultured Methanobrevibacter sp.]